MKHTKGRTPDIRIVLIVAATFITAIAIIAEIIMKGTNGT